MPDCSSCLRPLGRYRVRCKSCGACEECCDCESSDGLDPELFDADELGLDPETFDVAVLERKKGRS